MATSLRFKCVQSYSPFMKTFHLFGLIFTCKMSSQGPPLNEQLKGVSWLLGKWKSENGQGTYPTLKDFKYGEEVEFTHVGQPNLQFSCYSWHFETKKPLHRELGFVRVQPGTNKVALIIAQNLGVCELEEGEVNGHEVITTSHTVGRLTFGKPPVTKKIKRTFRLEGDTLQQVVEMETDKTPMTEHLKITFPPLDEHLKGVSWLLGKWRSEDGHGTYPTLNDFKFGEEVEFTHVGQPNLQFSCCSWYFETKKPKHREVGFVRVQPGTNKVGLIIAQNLGVCEVEEGDVNGQEMITTSHTVGQLTFGRDHVIRKVKRTFRREGDTLHKIIEMETDKTPLTEHIRITYKKMN